MQLAMIGLGRMGANIVRRLMRDGHSCVVFDANPKAADALAGEGATAVKSLAELKQRLQPPRAAWVMVPAGEITETTVKELGDLFEKGDVIIDGGNSFWKDDIRRAKKLKEKGVHYLDVGTSGGIWGLDRGYCMMIGGDTTVVQHLDPIFRTLAPGLGDIPRTEGREKRDPRPELGYLHAGPNGAGHFVKMVHNGIEYGLMQAYAEGFDIMHHANSTELPPEHRFDLSLPDIAEVWRRGSVISSWLLDLTSSAFAADEKLDSFAGHVEDSGEGRWTVLAAVESAVPADVLTTALYTRFRSRESESFAEKLLSAMRKGFGGHHEAKLE